MPKDTITSIFIMPTLGLNRDGLNSNGYLNAYCKDLSRDIQYENAVYLLFKPKNLDKFKDFEDDQINRKGPFIESYDLGDGYIVLVYALKLELKKDFELIKKSKYSETSKEFQSLFPEKKTIIKKGEKPRTELSLQNRVFNKDKSLIKYWEDRIGIRFKQNMELWEGYEEEREILDIDKIKRAELV